MKIFAIIHATSGDYGATYDGMDESVVLDMLQKRGLVFDVVSEKEYQNFVEAQIPIETVPDPLKDQAKLTLKNTLATTDQKVNAIITLLDLNK